MLLFFCSDCVEAIKDASQLKFKAEKMDQKIEEFQEEVNSTRESMSERINELEKNMTLQINKIEADIKQIANSDVQKQNSPLTYAEMVSLKSKVGNIEVELDTKLRNASTDLPLNKQ
ncbi:hypothetical protein HHI36_001028 [Cryptolaemus montrouzieri]|uniref:Uncharacterized protein n=1 Tax=Cryptolaemus montrouzieri TaxID=559131 RepID=A0ABD2P708_9CUCU